MARFDEQDFDEKRLARRARRKKSQLAAYITLGVIVVVVLGLLIFGIHMLRKALGSKPAAEEATVEATEEVSSEPAVIETPEETEEVQEYTEEELMDEVLGSILSEILSPSQYEENAATKQGSRNRVEFAVKLPADDGGFIYLPIDSKFPGDTYIALRDAIESGDKMQIDICEKALLNTIRSEAKDIHDKYIDPPHTTDFAVMFLPFEGLYSEVVNRGMVEELQHKYKVSIAGPSTMAALLNALQMGFRTLAVQKRSAEVWDVLRSVKKEFDSFADVLEKTHTRLDQANKELDALVGVRTRQMQKQLAKVGSSESGELKVES